jgi:hypothetical protein
VQDRLWICRRVGVARHGIATHPSRRPEGEWRYA